MSPTRSFSSQELDALLSPSNSSMPSDVSASAPSKDATKPLDRPAFLALTTGLVLFAGASWWIVLVENWPKLGGLKWFAGHPTAQSLGIVLVVAAIGQLQPTSTPSSKAKGLQLHQSLILIAALPTLAFGSLAMVYNKASHGAEHFTTWHAWFGLATLGVIGLQIIFGLATVTPALAELLGGTNKAKRYWKYHRALGYILVALLLFTAHLGGAHSTWALGSSSTTARAVGFWLGLPLIALGLGVRLRPTKLGF